MSGDTSEAAAWVRRALGVDLPAAAAARPAPGWQGARQAWIEANDAVNDQLNGLRRALLDRARDGDGELDGLAEALTEIAERGLNAVTEDHRVKLMAAVMDIGNGEAASVQKSSTKALGMIGAFQTFLAGSAKIEVCDANPFGAPVSIRATLTPALQALAASLQAATAGA